MKQQGVPYKSNMAGSHIIYIYKNIFFGSETFCFAKEPENNKSISTPGFEPGSHG